MARDPKLWKRNAFVLPGGLLTLYALAGLLYVAAYRAPTASCAGATHRFLVGGHCYSAYPFLVALLILGLALVVVGLYVFRGAPAELPGHLHPGTPTHFFLTLLASLVVVPAAVWVVLYYVEASQNLTPFMTRLSGYPFQTKFLFLLVALAALAAFGAFLGLYLAQARLRRTFLRQVDEVAAQEEAPFPGEPAARPASDDLTAPPPEEFVDESLWPESRAAELPPAPAVAATPNGSAPWTPPPSAPAAKTEPVTGATKVVPRTAAPAAAPVVAVAAGCRAILPTGMECGKPVGPGGRYCLSHACQGRTAAGAPCRNPAMEGSTFCPAHSMG